ncbi:RNase H-like domain-containing protein, partial [Enterobacter hormaechei]|uniref:RNase H-like domain-containing protein n=1 Tax=Enterobacter hormaechei TaxID=158836 RepID=UPI003CC75A11
MVLIATSSLILILLIIITTSIRSILYISAMPTALGALLAQHDDYGRERAIYYISRTLVGYELNYMPMEKACLAVVFS